MYVLCTCLYIVCLTVLLCVETISILICMLIIIYFSSRTDISVLVPGAGLGRLMFDIAKLGKMTLGINCDTVS